MDDSEDVVVKAPFQLDSSMQRWLIITGVSGGLAMVMGIIYACLTQKDKIRQTLMDCLIISESKDYEYKIHNYDTTSNRKRTKAHLMFGMKWMRKGRRTSASGYNSGRVAPNSSRTNSNLQRQASFVV